MNNNIFSINNKIIPLIKEDENVSMVMCYLTCNCNSNDLCRTTLKNIIEDNGYVVKSSNDKNGMSIKIKDTLRLLISKGIIEWATNPIKNKRKEEPERVGFDKITNTDDLWFKVNSVKEKYILINTQDYYDIVNWCLAKNNDGGSEKVKINTMLNIYLYVVKHINAQEENGKCNVGYNRFVEELGVSKRTVSRYTGLLVDMSKLFKKKGGMDCSNEYYLKKVEE